MALDIKLTRPVSAFAQYLVFAGLSLGVAGLAGASHFSENAQALSGFRRFLGRLDPLIAVFLASILGFFLLSRLLSRGWFSIYGREDLRGLLVSSSLAANFALIIILLESARLVVYPADLNVMFPGSLMFYPVMAYIVEVFFHLLPLSALIWAVTSLFKKISYRSAIWPCLFIVALVEPIFQVLLGFSSENTLWTNLYGNFIHVYLINIAQLLIFKRYDFTSMYFFRLVYYSLWHIVWGSVRLNLLF